MPFTTAWPAPSADVRRHSRYFRTATAIATPQRMTAVVAGLYALGGFTVLAGVLAVRPERWLPLSLLGATGVVVAAALAARRNVPSNVLAALPALGAVIVTADIALAAGTPLAHAYALLYLFVIVDASFFFDWWTAALHWAVVAVAQVTTAFVTGVSWVEVGAVLVTLGVAGGVTGWLVRVAALAGVDPLTGLVDRGVGDREIEAAVGRVARTGEDAALVLIDLDAFSTLNHEQGVAAGDDVLVQVAGACAAVVAGTGTGCRFGSDEFLLILARADREQALVTVADLRRRVAPVRFSAAVTTVSRADTRAGIAWRLMTALRGATEQGGGATVVADDSATATVRLREAIAGGELEMHYQPIVHLGRREVVGLEALVRWRDPDRGLVPPDSFVPHAERDGTIVDLGRWVVAEVCRQMRQWAAEGVEVPVAVNASHAELNRSDFADRFLRTCREHGVPPSAIVVEVTETTVARTEDRVMANLERLRAAGVGVSIDDFGTGYSSLARLQRLPVTQLKIDRAFVAALEDGGGGGPVLSVIVALGAALGLDVVAEGIETPAQAEVLGRLGVRHGQGYHFARPMCAAQLAAGLVRRGP
ncbi:GGDEF domain-containing phosphodiesterase [Isoptericola sp. b441]|uniref:GGDEF domain-containing phosphodiesterase n=1 Tax=Actinotalea lenta TaxID=3064654 RepID=A0ABT9DBP2_9CELL|nr:MULTISPECIES: GGDEF domain-containing phosphodiesterase [unclassified Isoptericola]MDO8107603.1 GGDEF domain-containing phosphodiesterase [Isoptericola sp. b441]MDO8120737.1 GGDEF domain-containing phosphodiesterase [Isoptericola sp. b490]